MILKIYKKVKRKIHHKIHPRLLRFCMRSGFLASVFYLFNKSFYRESKATLAGIVKHREESKKLKANYFLLVRNTHRIEKGLLMRPKRAVFGKDYIQETIESFEGIWKNLTYHSNPQMKWFCDVLIEYFTSAGTDPHIAIYHKKFLNIIADFDVSTSSDCRSIPYFRQESQKSAIDFDEFYKLTKQRRSVRWFKDTPVPRELINKALLAASQSPSACNRQPFIFDIIDDPGLVNEVVSFPMGTAGYGHTIPVLIVLVGNLDAYFDERDRHVIYIDASLAAMSFMLALETLGLSSCAINWPDIEEKEIKMENFLKLESHQRPIMCLGIGYADPEGMVAFSEKRSLSDFSRYNLVSNK